MQNGAMHARSAVLDVYGDLLAARGHRTTVAGLVRLLAPVGISGPAVRTAVSRMVAQGWLQPVRLADGRGYAATPRALRHFEQANARVHRRADPVWDGSWHVVLPTPQPHRTARARLARELTHLGCAELRDGVWVSPYARPELNDLLERCGTQAVVARATDVAPADAPLAAWDLEALYAAYEAWLEGAAARVRTLMEAHDDPDEAAFAARFDLVHEWRTFLFTDPALPASLLPDTWPGRRASEFFRTEAARLQEGSDRFVDRVLGAC